MAKLPLLVALVPLLLHGVAGLAGEALAEVGVKMLVSVPVGGNGLFFDRRLALILPS